MVAAIEGTQRVVHPEKDFYFDDTNPLNNLTNRINPGLTAEFFRFHIP